MKIAHVVDSMAVGGAETLVAQMCRLQREQGHDPSVYAICELGALGEQMRTEGFSVQANVGRHLVDSAVSFYRIFKKLHPDVVHLHNPTPTIYASAPARAAGAKAIVSTRHSLVGPPHNQVMERKYGVAAKFCDWIVGICGTTTNNIRNLRTVPVQKIVGVYNGTIPIALAAPENLPDKSGFTFLYVGRLELIKNHDLLLNAFCMAVAIQPSLQLWIVGDGTQRNHLEELSRTLKITAQVKFWGQQLDVARFFRSADALIMSSHSEGLPMSLLQGFSAGLPAIVTDVGGMAEVVRLAQAGNVVPPDDVKTMSSAILQMATHPEQHQQFSKNASTAFQAHFRIETMLDAYMELYQTSKPRRR